MSLFKKSYKKFFNYNKTIIIKKASDIILFHYIDKNFLVYNGKEFLKIIVKKEMVGFFFGEFILTRKPFCFQKKKKK